MSIKQNKSIINTFYGAIIGFWIVYAFEKIISKNWLSFIPLFILVFVIRSFYEFNTMPENSPAKERLYYLLVSLICSFAVSVIIQVVDNPEISLLRFVLSPKTWFFSLIIILWTITLYPPNIKILLHRGG